MASLLSSMDAPSPRMASSSSRKRKPSPTRKVDMRKTPRSRMEDTGFSSESDHIPDALSPFKRRSSPAIEEVDLRSSKRPKGSSDDPVGVTNGINKLGFKSEATEPDEFDLMDLDDSALEAVAMDDFGLAQDDGDVFDDQKDVKGKNSIVTSAPSARLGVKKKEEDAQPSWLSLAASLAKVEGPSDSADALLSEPIDPSNASKVNALEDDSSLRMFWLDYLELGPKVYFIGKVLDRSSGKGSKPRWVSCCVTVDNVERNLFVLPREHRVSGSALL